MKLPDPDAGYADSLGYVNTGQPIYFLVTFTPSFNEGDTFIWTSETSDPGYMAYNGEYTFASAVYDTGAALWRVYTKTIGTETNLIA